MNCSNPDCGRAIGLIAYQRGWLSKRRHCSRHCRDAFGLDLPNSRHKRTNSLLGRFVVASVAFVGLLVPATFTMAVLAAPPADPDMSHLPGCERNLESASASIAAVQARMRSLNNVERSEICNVTRLYFFEIVKARAVTALCKSGSERERDLGRFDSDVEHANEAIAARCL
jgi:hypothetical protein